MNTITDVLADPPTRRELSRRIKQAARSDRLYELLAPWQCGAFDGGCLMVADALHQLFGGELVGMLGYNWVYAQHGGPTDSGWDHALVRIGDYYLDGDGFSTRQTLRRRWYAKELCYVTGFMVMPPFNHLDEFEIAATYTVYRHDVVAALVELFRQAILS